jgi:hypothetical protein
MSEMEGIKSDSWQTMCRENTLTVYWKKKKKEKERMGWRRQK